MTNKFHHKIENETYLKIHNFDFICRLPSVGYGVKPNNKLILPSGVASSYYLDIPSIQSAL